MNVVYEGGENKSGSYNEKQKYGLSSFYSQGLSHITVNIYPAILFHLVSVFTLSPGGNSQSLEKVK